MHVQAPDDRRSRGGEWFRVAGCEQPRELSVAFRQPHHPYPKKQPSGRAAGIGSVFLGVVLLLAFALGRAIPVALGAFAVSWLENLSGLARYHRGFEIAGGITLILMGLYMLNAVLFWIPTLAM